MCMPKPPSTPKSVKSAQEAEVRAQAEETARLKEEQLMRTKSQQAGYGIRSLISSPPGAGFGRNFLA